MEQVQNCCILEILTLRKIRPQGLSPCFGSYLYDTIYKERGLKYDLDKTLPTGFKRLNNQKVCVIHCMYNL